MKHHHHSPSHQSQQRQNGQQAQSVQQRAYEIYVKRGQQPGHELEDWLQAEQEVGQQAKQQSGL